MGLQVKYDVPVDHPVGSQNVAFLKTLDVGADVVVEAVGSAEVPGGQPAYHLTAQLNVQGGKYRIYLVLQVGGQHSFDLEAALVFLD